MKLASTRIDETIAFIQNYGTFPMVRRQAVAQFCRQTYPRLSLLDFGPYSSEFHTLSSEMSVKQHATVPAGNQTDRAKRRAIFLIWKCLGKLCAAGDLPGAQSGMTMSTAALDAALTHAMLGALACANATFAAEVFNDLAANPEAFMATHKMIVLGSPEGASKFHAVGHPPYTNIRDFKFKFNPLNDLFEFAVGSDPRLATHPVKAVSVPAVPWYDVPGNGGKTNPAQPANASFAQILGCELTGANLMVTTQFTGCAFCWTDQGGVVRAAHIGPADPLDVKAGKATTYRTGGHDLAQDLVAQAGANTAGMANAPGAALSVFGRGAGNIHGHAPANQHYPNLNLKHGTIIGFNAGAWRLYFQAIDSATNQIAEARRIL